MQDEQTYTRGEMDNIMKEYIKKNSGILRKKLQQEHKQVEYV
ncbi:hypothetical protein N9J72_02840 [Candidatus Gracilibacteria bacterium]|nr:hypothetical protein [Candidatus Gracilibacteria bacterium]